MKIMFKVKKNLVVATATHKMILEIWVKNKLATVQCLTKRKTVDFLCTEIKSVFEDLLIKQTKPIKYIIIQLYK
mgnify:CR=1 FL=1